MIAHARTHSDVPLRSLPLPPSLPPTLTQLVGRDYFRFNTLKHGQGAGGKAAAPAAAAAKLRSAHA